jgi:hypothetical protein
MTVQCPRILKAEAVGDSILRITFTNGDLRDYDITPLLTNRTFSPLRQPAFFKSFTVESGGYAIVWNDAIDLSEYELWSKGSAVQATIDVAPIRHDERFRALVERE